MLHRSHLPEQGHFSFSLILNWTYGFGPGASLLHQSQVNFPHTISKLETFIVGTEKIKAQVSNIIKATPSKQN